MMDMMVMALACDITAVATFQWSDTEAKHTFPWLGLTEHHHFYQHDGGFRPAECEQICTWYSEQHLYLLQAMDAVDMGGHTLLDESVVFFGSELAEPPSHSKTNMPFLLAGGGGGLRGGRCLRNDGWPTLAQQPAGLDPQPVRRRPADLRRPEVLQRTTAQPRLKAVRDRPWRSRSRCGAPTGTASSPRRSAPPSACSSIPIAPRGCSGCRRCSTASPPSTEEPSSARPGPTASP